ncbi:MAG: DUF4430 domain-containing protein [Lachnospiraceae bacterium]|nr:DUF4430 domain-containing protein [Lachnospiraceae bacterium]
MKNKKLTIILAVVAVVVLGCVLWFILGGGGAKDDGHITVTVQDKDGKILAEKKIGYKEGDKLADLVEKNFKNVKYEDSGYGPMIMEIESLTTPADWSSYISILYNGEYAQVGIGQLEFKDGDKIDFVDTVYIPTP